MDDGKLNLKEVFNAVVMKTEKDKII